MTCCLFIPIETIPLVFVIILQIDIFWSQNIIYNWKSLIIQEINFVGEKVCHFYNGYITDFRHKSYEKREDNEFGKKDGKWSKYNETSRDECVIRSQSKWWYCIWSLWTKNKAYIGEGLDVRTRVQVKEKRKSRRVLKSSFKNFNVSRKGEEPPYSLETILWEL